MNPRDYPDDRFGGRVSFGELIAKPGFRMEKTGKHRKQQTGRERIGRKKKK